MRRSESPKKSRVFHIGTPEELNALREQSGISSPPSVKITPPTRQLCERENSDTLKYCNFELKEARKIASKDSARLSAHFDYIMRSLSRSEKLKVIKEMIYKYPNLYVESSIAVSRYSPRFVNLMNGVDKDDLKENQILRDNIRLFAVFNTLMTKLTNEQKVEELEKILFKYPHLKRGSDELLLDQSPRFQKVYYSI